MSPHNQLKESTMLFLSFKKSDLNPHGATISPVECRINGEPQLVTVKDGIVSWLDQQRHVFHYDTNKSGLVTIYASEDDGDIDFIGVREADGSFTSLDVK